MLLSLDLVFKFDILVFFAAVFVLFTFTLFSRNADQELGFGTFMTSHLEDLRSVNSSEGQSV